MFARAKHLRPVGAGSPRRGYSIVYIGLLMLAAFGLVSLAVDLGRVRVGRLQLSTAADAAALAGVWKLPVPDVAAARQDAVNVGAQNTAIQGTGGATTINLDPNVDVEPGIYRKNGGTFTAVGQTEPNGNTVDDHSCNACRVSARRIAGRNNAIGLFFARAINVNEVDVVGRAIAWLSGDPGGTGMGFIGLDWVRINGTTNTDSYNAQTGPYGGTNVRNNGGVGSNGTITMVGTSDIHGNARPGTDYYVDRTPNTTVTGWTAPLDYTLVYPPKPVPYNPSSYNNDAIDDYLTGTKLKPNVSATIPPGTYSVTEWSPTADVTIDSVVGSPVEIYITGTKGFDVNGVPLTINGDGKVTFFIAHNVKMNGHASIIINGADQEHRVTFNVNGDWSANGGDLTNNGAASNLYINMTGVGSSMDISTNTKAHIYAPLTDVVFHGNAQNPPADFFGWCIGKTLTVKGNSELHYDETLTGQGDGKLHVSLVK